jgi:hypothetical protein
LSNPGLIMQAIAAPNHVNASSAFGPSSLSGFGDDAGPLISATTNIVQGTNSVTVDAKTAISDLSVGPLYIGAIVSTAHATSDGTHAPGTTDTQITGVKIAGIGVTIDSNGVELSGKSLLPASVIKTLNKTINSALKAAGIQIYLAQASKSVHGAQVQLDSGDLIVSLHKAGYKTALNDTGTVLQLGGASINANATEGYVPPTIGSSPAPISSTGASTGGGLPSLQTPPSLPSGSQTEPSTAPAPVLAAKPLSLPGALSSWWIVGGVLLALLAALALGLLPGRALAAGAACSLEEDS